jgi:hypothetical protein
MSGSNHRSNGSAAAEILRYEREVSAVMKQMARRTHYEPATADTPVSELMRSEGDMDGLTEMETWAIRNETIRRFFEFILADGPEPCQVLRRLYAAGSHMMIRPFCDLTLREKALMFGESHGAQHWRMKRVVTDPLRRNGAKAIKGPGQKGSRAAESASRAQQGNSNRLGGKKLVGKGKEHFRRGQKRRGKPQHPSKKSTP